MPTKPRFDTIFVIIFRDHKQGQRRFNNTATNSTPNLLCTRLSQFHEIAIVALYLSILGDDFS